MRDERQELVQTLKALANPLRLRIIASLTEEPKHAYALAKELGVSYPLAHLHLKGLRKLGLIREIDHEGADEGRPTRTYAPTEFEVTLTPETIHEMFLNRGES